MMENLNYTPRQIANDISIHQLFALQRKGRKTQRDPFAPGAGEHYGRVTQIGA